MTEKPNERVIANGSAEQRRAALEALPELLASLAGPQVISAVYDYGCHLHPELCHVPMKVGTSWLCRFIRESLEQRIVVLDESDFVFIVREGELEVEFCHEGHIHLSGTNAALVSNAARHPSFLHLQTRAPNEPEV